MSTFDELFSGSSGGRSSRRRKRSAGFDDLFGTKSEKRSDPSPVEEATNDLTSALQKAAELGTKIATKASPMGAVMNVIDIPRAAIASTVKEVSDAVGGGGNASFSDWWGQISDEDRRLGLGDWDVIQFDDNDSAAMRALKGGAAFLGDVVADPATYVGGAGIYARAGRKLAAEGTEAVARKAGKEAIEKAAQRSGRLAKEVVEEGGEKAAKHVTETGVAWLRKEAAEAYDRQGPRGLRAFLRDVVAEGDDEVAEQLWREMPAPVRGGLEVGVPGSRRFSRQFMDTGRSWQERLGQMPAGEGAGRALDSLGERYRAGKQQFWGSRLNPLGRLGRDGDVRQAYVRDLSRATRGRLDDAERVGYEALDAREMARDVEKRVRRQVLGQAAEYVSDWEIAARKAADDGQLDEFNRVAVEVANTGEVPDGAPAGAVEMGRKFRELRQRLLQQQREAGVHVGENDALPLVLTPDGIRYLDIKYPNTQARPSDQMLSRQQYVQTDLVVDDTGRLVDTRVSHLDPIQIQKLIEDGLAEGVQMFEQDLGKIMTVIARNAERRVSSEMIGQSLLDRGLVRELLDEPTTTVQRRQMQDQAVANRELADVLSDLYDRRADEMREQLRVQAEEAGDRADRQVRQRARRNLIEARERVKETREAADAAERAVSDAVVEAAERATRRLGDVPAEIAKDLADETEVIAQELRKVNEHAGALEQQLAELTRQRNAARAELFDAYTAGRGTTRRTEALGRVQAELDGVADEIREVRSKARQLERQMKRRTAVLSGHPELQRRVRNVLNEERSVVEALQRDARRAERAAETAARAEARALGNLGEVEAKAAAAKEKARQRVLKRDEAVTDSERLAAAMRDSSKRATDALDGAGFENLTNEQRVEFAGAILKDAHRMVHHAKREERVLKEAIEAAGKAGQDDVVEALTETLENLRRARTQAAKRRTLTKVRAAVPDEVVAELQASGWHRFDPSARVHMPENLDHAVADHGIRLAMEGMERFATQTGKKEFDTFMGRVMDPWMAWFRTSVTSGRGPGYVARNVVGGWFNAWTQDLPAAGFSNDANKMIRAFVKAERQAREELGGKRKFGLLTNYDGYSEADVARLVDEKMQAALGGIRPYGDDGPTLYEAWRNALNRGILEDNRTLDYVPSSGLNREDAVLRGLDESTWGPGVNERMRGQQNLFTKLDEDGNALPLNHVERLANFFVNNRLVQTNIRLARNSEIYLRFGSYSGGLRKYGTDEMGEMMAELMVKMTQFDYSDLSDFEARYIRGMAIPFWSWMKNNIPLQLSVIARKPGKLNNVRKFEDFVRSQLEGDYSDQYPVGLDGEPLLPDWMKERGMFLSQFTVGGSPIALSSTLVDLPSRDLHNWAGDGLFPVEFDELWQGLNPMLKLAYEQMTGRDSFTGQEFGAEPVPGWASVLSEVPVFGKGTDQYGNPTVSERATSTIRDLLPQFAQVEALTGIGTERTRQAAPARRLSQLLGLGAGTYSEAVAASTTRGLAREVEAAARKRAAELGIDWEDWLEARRARIREQQAGSRWDWLER